jgi:LysR family transcriptional regulator, hydrogen peroxide-inducible genes activator
MKGLGSLSIRDLEAVLVVAETLHFGRAAERCGMAQASLSVLVQRVEKATEVRVFERTSRSCKVTPEGVLVLEVIERLLRTLDEVERAPGESGTLRGSVRLGFIPTLGPYFVPFLLPALIEAFPAARFFFFEALTEQLIGMIRSRRVDAGFLSFPSRGEALAEFPLFQEELLLAFPRGHRLAGRRRIAHSEIPRDELILMDHGHCLRDHTLQVCGEGRISAVPVHATSIETLRFMVGSGVGCAVVPALSVAAAAASKLVVYRKFADPVPTRTIGLVTRPESEAQRLAAPLIELVGKLCLPNIFAGEGEGGELEAAPRGAPAPAPDRAPRG